MKIVIRLFCILSLVTLALVGCSSSDEGKAKKVAEEVVRNIYTVDAEKVAKYNTPVPEPEGDPMSEEYNKKNAEEFLKIIKSVDKNILPLMTEQGYLSMLPNQFNSVNTKICAKENYTTQVVEVTLGENVYKDYKDEVKLRYRYEVKFKFISLDGKSEKADSAVGAVELLKEDGKWKVSSFDITKYPKLYK